MEKIQYQEDRNDEAKETNGAAEDFNDEYLDEECWIGSIRKSSSRSNLRKDWDGLNVVAIFLFSTDQLKETKICLRGTGVQINWFEITSKIQDNQKKVSLIVTT